MITFIQLKAALMRAPRNVLHVQGGQLDTSRIISCKHPKFNTTLYVSEVGKKFIKYSGNIRNALKMTSNTAKNVRDDVLEHKTNVTIQRC